MPTARWAFGFAVTGFLLVVAASGGASPTSAAAGLNESAAAWSPENRQTARAALDKVTAKAKAWHADAALIKIQGLADDNGAADNGFAVPGTGWNYWFLSPSAKRKVEISVYEGGLHTSGEQDTAPADRLAKPFAPTFADSDKAMAEAHKNGFSGDSGNYNTELSNTPKGSVAKESFCWTLVDDGGTTFYISATSGKLVGKWKPGQ